MEYTKDTIAAISTPLGEGGIGIVRISGPQAFSITENLFRSPDKMRVDLSTKSSHSIQFGYLESKSELIDTVLVSLFKSPRSYTTEDVIEISCHGGQALLQRILVLVLQEGARMAEPGEFTKRAFFNGRLDLAQSEAVADLIAARNESQRHMAMRHLEGAFSQRIQKLRSRLLDTLSLVEVVLDFPEEDVPSFEMKKIMQSLRSSKEQIEQLLKTAEMGRWIKKGIKTVIIGKPNVGKSTLLNVLLQEERSIVTSIPGTTRDIIEEEITFDGVTFRLFDTAGLRNPRGKIELEGVKRSQEKLSTADLVLLVIDGSKPVSSDMSSVVQAIKGKKSILVINKMDIANKGKSSSLSGNICCDATVEISAMTGDGIDALQKLMLASFVDVSSWHEYDIAVTNIRHEMCLQESLKSIKAVLDTSVTDFKPELIAIDLHMALDKLAEIIGEVSSEDVLTRIFEKFCIGK